MTSMIPPEEGEEVVPVEKEYKTKWIYERWNKVINTAEYPDLPGTLGEVLKNSRQEIRSNKVRV